MSERKLDQIENMFKKTKQPKLEIEDIHEVEKLGVILDDTTQGEIALDIATSLAQRLNVAVDIAISEEYYEAIKILLEGTAKEINALKQMAQEKIEEKGIYAKTDLIVAAKVEKVLELFEEEVKEEDKVGERLVRKLEEMASDIVVLGVPIFRSREEEEAENLGGYVTKLLRAQRIHSNFLLATDITPSDLGDTILSLVSIEQQPGSIVALTRRALSLSNEDTDIRLVGMIDDKMIETVARVDQMDEEIEVDEEGQEELDLDSATEKLRQKMDETLSSISIKGDIPHKSFSYEVRNGSIASIVNTALDEIKPGLVMVRSVVDIAENLDPIAEQITRIVLRSGYPCLVVWD